MRIVISILCSVILAQVQADTDPFLCSAPLVLNGTTGEVQSPGFPLPYSINLDCTWILNISSQPKDVYIQLEVLDLDVGDELHVHNGDVNATIIHNFTSKQEFGMVYSSAVSTTIRFISDNTSTQRSEKKFKLAYTTDECVIAAKQSNGVLPSPYFVAGNGTLNCTYKLENKDTDKVIALTFVKVDLHKSQVMFNEGNKTIATYDETTKPDDLLMVGQSVSINMLLAKSQQQIFTTVFSKTQGCSRMIQVTERTELDSLWYPANYDNNINCRWVIHSPEGSTMSLNFTEFQLADDIDQIVIKDGGSQSSETMFSSGSQTDGISYVTSSNAAWIAFKTNQILGSSLFKLEITPLAFGSRFVNMGTFTLGGENNTNTSIPLYDDFVSYQFQAPQSSQVYLEFDKEALLLPNTYIECYDGLSNTDPLVGNFTSTDAFRPVFSNGNTMLVLINGFIRNGSMTLQLLSGSFKAVTNDGTLYNSLDVAGGLSLSQKKDRDPWEATWLIHNHDDRELISLKLNLVKLGPNSSLSVYQGLADQDFQITKLTTSASNLPLIYIPKEKEGCRVSYETNHPPINQTNELTEGTQVVLQATYSLIPNCDVSLADMKGSVTTPGYPNLYPYNAICTTVISIPKQKMAHMTFTTFDLAPFHDLTIAATSNITTTTLDKFGGQEVPHDFVSGSNDTEISVVFSSSFTKNPSGAMEVSYGVNMTYEIIDCGGNMTVANATLSTPGYPSTVGNLTCVWLITLPTTTVQNDSVNIVSFTISGSPDNNSMLVIRDGLSSSSESIPINETSAAILSRTNVLWVKYTHLAPPKPSLTAASGFRIVYSTYECPKKQQCKTVAMCMHEDWKCNGEDNCGDGSDEEGCTYGHHDKDGYAGWALAVAILATFVIAVGLTLVAQAIYKRFRYQNYDELRDLMAPVPT